MEIEFLERNFFQRLLGRPATTEPLNPDCWEYRSGSLIIDLTKAPEFDSPAGALRFEGKGLPDRVLVVKAAEDYFHAFQNRCTHFGHRRLDPVPGTRTVQCCSVSKSTYGFDGKPIYGPAPNPIALYKVRMDGAMLTVDLL